ncbi:alpha/beta fold hydrolase [Ruegeria halocynthiae]|uniref:alpha/beta fold hydrolase n=1 Tax=Ruegeria halocynthiae TaxID=985054 RepID=UPI00136221FE|nr:alpha/beta hydrolase [Ruegeria halocynthiae]
MLKIILLSLLALAVIAVIGVFAIFYKSDLTREDLAEYVTDESQFIDLPNGANMHFRDEGNPDGPVLVMIHGGFGSLQNWEGWVENLSDDYRLISMDLLGHGLTGAYPEQIYTRITERDAVHQLLQEIGVDKYTVAGNSFGGGIALEMALAYPDQVEGLILVDSEGIPNGEDGYDTSLFNADDAGDPNSSEFTQLSWMEKLGSKFIGPTVVRSVMDSMTANKDLLTKQYVDYFSRPIRYEGNREAQILMFRQGLYQIQQNGPQDLLPRLPELKMPTLVMQGAEDTLVPMRVGEKFRDNIENAELAVIPAAGHMPMMEKPKETAQVVRDFMESRQIGLN